MRHAGELLHGRITGVCTELSLASYPRGTFLGDSFLGQFILEPDFKFRTVQTVFPAKFGQVELPPLFLQFIRDLIRQEGWGREKKLQAFDGGELRFQCLEGVNGKAGGCNADFRVRYHRTFEIISKQTIDVVYNVHAASKSEIIGAIITPFYLGTSLLFNELQNRNGAFFTPIKTSHIFL